MPYFQTDAVPLLQKGQTLSLKMTWTQFFSRKGAIPMALATVATFGLALYSYTHFLRQVEQRPGITFLDPFHAAFGPVDLTWPIILTLYVAVLWAVGVMSRSPEVLFKALRAYTMLIGIRIVCMYVLPLDPPSTMIVLRDPFVEALMPGAVEPLTRDLFFSGHTSMMFLLGFVLTSKILRRVYFTFGMLVGLAVIAQHVHYTVDVVVAPMAAWAAVVLSGALPQVRKGHSKS